MSLYLPFRSSKLPKGPGILRTWGDSGDEGWFDRLPESVKRNLSKPYSPFGPRASGLGWEEVIYTPINDGTVNTAGTEAIMVPDFSIPAGYMTVGKILKYTLMGRVSTAITTPGVLTLRLRWGGVAGTEIVRSGGFIPDVTAASTTLAFMVEWFSQCRTVGTSGTQMGWGRIEMPDANDVDITNFVIEYNKRIAAGLGTAIPVVATTDTTIDKLLSSTFANSLGTGSMTTHVAILEACN
jgi:hypothetical protein